MLKAMPRRMDIAHEVSLIEPNLEIGANPATTLGEVYRCVSLAFTITPTDITVTKSDNIGQAKLAVSVLKGSGTIEFTASGYTSRFENLTDDDQIRFVLERIGEFNHNIQKLPAFQEHRNSTVYFATWYEIDGGRPATDTLLNSITSLDVSEQLGATSSWTPAYRRGYYNQDENWILTVTLEPSSLDVAHLYCSVLAHYYPQEANRSVSKMVAHTHEVRDIVLKLIGIEVPNA